MTADVLVGVNFVLGGIALCAALACWGIWLLERRSRAYLWMSVLAVAISVQLVSGAVLIDGDDASVRMAATFVRSTASMSAAILAVHTAGQLLPGLPTRRVVQTLSAIGVVRVALWWPTDLIVRNPMPADGRTEFGPLGVTWFAFVLGLAVTGGIAVVRQRGRSRWWVAFGVVAFVSLALLPGHVTDPVLFNELVTLNVVPAGLTILVLATRTVVQGARNRSLLAHRQRVFARLGRKAMYEPVDALRLITERTLRTELGSDDLFVRITALSPEPAGATRSSTPMQVRGRRQTVTLTGVRPMDRATRDFVETLLRILVASADRADADTEFAHRATHDELTGLPNLELLRSRLDDRLLAKSPTEVLLMLCRVGRMGRTVATEGLDHGNALLSATATALQGLRRPDTIVARMSTDHFAILEYLPADDPDGFLVARLRTVRATAGAAADGVVHVGAVVGRPGSTADSMLRDAATAVERSRGESRTVLFDEELSAQLRTRVALERDLAHALDRNEIEVRYQPVVDARTRAVVGCEALARWRRADTLVPADTWVPLAERSGLIHPIGRHILSIAAREQPRLGVPVAVNVSPLELGEEHFVDDVLQALGDRCPELVTLEITETAMMSDLDRSVAVLEQLRALGMQVALDDFGSSYSSLGALADLPVDVLKLDRSFVARLESPGGRAVVQAIIALGHALGKPIVAEGVETEGQLALLTDLGVDRVQGYLLGRPATAERMASGRARPVPRYSSSVR